MALRLHRRRGQQASSQRGSPFPSDSTFVRTSGLKALHRLSRRRMAVSFQWPKRSLAVDVLIRQIYAAGEGHLAIDDQDFPVIPVVIVGGEEGLDGGQRPCSGCPAFSSRRG